MSLAVNSSASAALDPAVKLNLQQHLKNIRPFQSPMTLTIGTKKQLEAAGKITASKKVSDCFVFDGTIREYPRLPKRNFLVACVYPFAGDEKVQAVYCQDQMQDIIDNCNAGYEKYIEWRVLEISEELEADLLQGVSF